MSTSPHKLLFVFAAAFFVPFTCNGQTTPPDRNWSADLTMYMLAPAMSGNTTIRGVYADVDVPFSDIWHNLQFGGMARPSLNYRRWVVSTDVIYMGLGAVRNNVDLGYDQWLIQPVAGYRLTSWLSPYAGARYLSVKGDIRGPHGRTATGKQEWWDPVVGADVRLPLSRKFAFQVRGDMGGFGAGSSFSGQIEPMLNWRVAKVVTLQFGYRWLYADYQTGAGTNLFRYDMLTQGPQFGGTFHF